MIDKCLILSIPVKDMGEGASTTIPYTSSGGEVGGDHRGGHPGRDAARGIRAARECVGGNVTRPRASGFCQTGEGG
jgi:hypothetical protein